MIGKIVLTMHVAAAKINQPSIVPAFSSNESPADDSSTKRCCIFITEGSIVSRWPEVPRNPFPSWHSPDAHRARLCLTDGPWDIVVTFEVLQYDYGFKAVSSGVRLPLEFIVGVLLEIILVNHYRQRLMYGVNLNVLAERHAALHLC